MKRSTTIWLLCGVLASGPAWAAGGDRDDDVDRKGTSTTTDDTTGNAGMGATGTVGSDRGSDPSRPGERTDGRPTDKVIPGTPDDLPQQPPASPKGPAR